MTEFIVYQPDVFLQYSSYKIPPTGLLTFSESINNKVINSKLEEKEKLEHCKGLLNKLTTKNFDKILDDLLIVGITTTQQIDGLINLIFEKGISEKNYANMYAQLCSELMCIKKEKKYSVEEAERMRSLTSALLEKCQKEYQSIITGTIDEQVKKLIIQLPTIVNMVDDDTTINDLLKRRQNGIIMFIGELYNLNIIPYPVIKNCIDTMIRVYIKSSEKEEKERIVDYIISLVSTIKLKIIKSLSSKVDNTKNKFKYIGTFFADVISDAKTSKRTKFQLNDILLKCFQVTLE